MLVRRGDMSITKVYNFFIFKVYIPPPLHILYRNSIMNNPIAGDMNGKFTVKAAITVLTANLSRPIAQTRLFPRNSKEILIGSGTVRSVIKRTLLNPISIRLQLPVIRLLVFQELVRQLPCRPLLKIKMKLEI